MADTHFSVEKGERDGRTYTRVVLLDWEQRKAELARITGGSRVTDGEDDDQNQQEFENRILEREGYAGE